MLLISNLSVITISTSLTSIVRSFGLSAYEHLTVFLCHVSSRGQCVYIFGQSSKYHSLSTRTSNINHFSTQSPTIHCDIMVLIISFITRSSRSLNSLDNMYTPIQLIFDHSISTEVYICLCTKKMQCDCRQTKFTKIHERMAHDNDG